VQFDHNATGKPRPGGTYFQDFCQCQPHQGNREKTNATAIRPCCKSNKGAQDNKVSGSESGKSAEANAASQTLSGARATSERLRRAASAGKASREE